LTYLTFKLADTD